MMKKELWTYVQRIFPLIGLILIIMIFSVLSGDKLWAPNNLLNILSVMIPLCLGGSGMVFVAAQGSTDMSQGSALALAGTVAGIASVSIGFWAFIPVALLTGLAVGAFNGLIVSKFKVSSLMVTLAMMIILRALVAYITAGQAIFVDTQVLELNRWEVKLPMVGGVVALMWYLFEYTKFGFFSRCIGENQTVGQFAGIPVNRYKIFAFMFSGLLAGLVSVYSVGAIGGISPIMGNFFELQVMMAMFVGGVPVTGGAGAKFYKVVIGALMLAFLKNGLTISKVGGEVSEIIQGLILIGVVFLGLFVRDKYIKRQAAKEA